MEILIILIVAFIIYLILGTDNTLNTITYDIKSNKLKNSIKIALIADLHSCDYKNSLLYEIDKNRPDLILLPGDIIDDRIYFRNGIDFLKRIGKKYPSYYVTGNHELRIDKKYEIKKLIASNNIHVLDGTFESISIKDSKLNIFGLDDYEIGEEIWTEQMNNLLSNMNPDEYNVLLSHRPEKNKIYFDAGFDLTVAGHSHGGQWRIPKVLNGLYSPNQGFFPKYAGGLYKNNKMSLIVSRGLAKKTTRTPRIFNPPELVFIHIN